MLGSTTGADSDASGQHCYDDDTRGALLAGLRAALRAALRPTPEIELCSDASARSRPAPARSALFIARFSILQPLPALPYDRYGKRYLMLLIRRPHTDTRPASEKKVATVRLGQSNTSTRHVPLRLTHVSSESRASD
jgi:hypothetical protein